MSEGARAAGQGIGDGAASAGEGVHLVGRGTYELLIALAWAVRESVPQLLRYRRHRRRRAAKKANKAAAS